MRQVMTIPVHRFQQSGTEHCDQYATIILTAFPSTSGIILWVLPLLPVSELGCLC